MNPRKFTWFPKLTDTVRQVPEEHRGAIMWALAEYGTYGVEPELEWPLNAIFAALKEDIDNSCSARSTGSRGGRPRKTDSDDSEGETGEPENGGFQDSDETEKGGFEVSEKSKRGVSEVSENQKGGFSDSDELQKGGFEVSEKTETHTKPYQAIPNQAMPEQGREGRARKRETAFSPPSQDEAREYAAELGMRPDEADKFRDHFEANGWRVSGKSPMRDWKAAMRNWQRRASEFTGKEGGKHGERDIYSLL